jgi:MoxR-like ATPase
VVVTVAEDGELRSVLEAIGSMSDAASRAEGLGPVAVPDQRNGAVYVLNDDIVLALKVAVITGRPLLLMGDPGAGKSSLAAYVARNLQWRYFEHVVTGRTEATDMLWTFDAVRKLADASRPDSRAADLHDEDYVEPGVLWWALDPASARNRGADRPPQRRVTEPNKDLNESRSARHAVVLLDEIDKADPDVPNALLVPLGSMQFEVAETQQVIRLSGAQDDVAAAAARARILLVITTNQERDLPPAFVRRCVVHRLPAPDDKMLVKIATAHAEAAGQNLTADDSGLCQAVASRVVALQKESEGSDRWSPGTAEYLDAVRACLELRLAVGGPGWERIERLTLAKDDAYSPAAP